MRAVAFRCIWISCHPGLLPSRRSVISGDARHAQRLGRPNGVTCRVPQALPGGGMGPKICMKNDVWVAAEPDRQGSECRRQERV